MSMPTPMESEEQISLVQYLKLKKLFYFAPMNENKQSFSNRGAAVRIEAKAKAMGKITGTPDIIVMLPNKILFIEMKRRAKILKSGKKSISHTSISKDQRIFLDKVSEYGYAESFVAYGAKEAIEFIGSHI